MRNSNIDRRQFGGAVAAAAASTSLLTLPNSTQQDEPFRLNYMLASCMYGYVYVGEILAEAAKTTATAIDIWPKVHGNQREQLSDLGEERFSEMLSGANLSLGCLTHYGLGPYGLKGEMELAKRLGCNTIVTGARGRAGLKGDDLKKEVVGFLEQLKPHLELAQENGVTIAIENHANSLIESPDSMKWLAELRPNPHVAIAFAPYHLPQDPEQLGKLIIELDDAIQVFYAWQHGMGCHKKLPKEQELLQMPGRGDLNFLPLIKALQEIEYSGWTEIFMHPVPRGISILESVAQVTEEINRSRDYLESFIEG